jgi:hypothetical protein
MVPLCDSSDFNTFWRVHCLRLMPWLCRTGLFPPSSVSTSRFLGLQQSRHAPKGMSGSLSPRFLQQGLQWTGEEAGSGINFLTWLSLAVTHGLHIKAAHVAKSPSDTMLTSLRNIALEMPSLHASHSCVKKHANSSRLRCCTRSLGHP